MAGMSRRSSKSKESQIPAVQSRWYRNPYYAGTAAVGAVSAVGLTGLGIHRNKHEITAAGRRYKHEITNAGRRLAKTKADEYKDYESYRLYGKPYYSLNAEETQRVDLSVANFMLSIGSDEYLNSTKNPEKKSRKQMYFDDQTRGLKWRDAGGPLTPDQVKEHDASIFKPLPTTQRRRRRRSGSNKSRRSKRSRSRSRRGRRGRRHR